MDRDVRPAHSRRFYAIAHYPAQVGTVVAASSPGELVERMREAERELAADRRSR